jgi:hypothetical protein
MSQSDTKSEIDSLLSEIQDLQESLTSSGESKVEPASALEAEEAPDSDGSDAEAVKIVEADDHFLEEFEANAEFAELTGEAVGMESDMEATLAALRPEEPVGGALADMLPNEGAVANLEGSSEVPSEAPADSLPEAALDSAPESLELSLEPEIPAAPAALGDLPPVMAAPVMEPSPFSSPSLVHSASPARGGDPLINEMVTETLDSPQALSAAALAPPLKVVESFPRPHIEPVALPRGTGAPASSAIQASASSADGGSMSLTLKGRIALDLTYQAFDRRVTLSFGESFLKVSLQDGTEFKIPVAKKGSARVKAVA